MSLIYALRDETHLLCSKIALKRWVVTVISKDPCFRFIGYWFVCCFVNLLHGRKVLFAEMSFTPKILHDIRTALEYAFDDAEIFFVFVLSTITWANGMGMSVQEIFHVPPVQFAFYHYLIRILPISGINQVVKAVFAYKRVLAL